MSRATVSLGGSAGERITIAMVLLTLCVEVLSDNGCQAETATPMTHHACASACFPRPIRKWESYACECEPEVPGGNVATPTTPVP